MHSPVIRVRVPGSLACALEDLRSCSRDEFGRTATLSEVVRQALAEYVCLPRAVADETGEALGPGPSLINSLL